MTPKEVVMTGYKLFSEGDLEGLNKINHEDALFTVSYTHLTLPTIYSV